MLETRVQNLHIASDADHIYGDDMLVKLEHDMQVARRIQANFLPDQLPEARWMGDRGPFPAGARSGRRLLRRLHALAEPAHRLCDGRCGGQGRARCALHGADAQPDPRLRPAELFAQLGRYARRRPCPNRAASASAGDELPSTGSISLQNAVLLTNNYILENHLKDNMFATLFFGMLDPSNGQLSYINAGHNPPFIVDAPAL